MSSANYVELDDRGIIAISGEDRRSFLQGLISNDVERLGNEPAIYAALLTPQGKFLFDFMVIQIDDRLLLDTEAARTAELLRRLMLYRLHAKVDIKDVSADYAVAAILPDAGIDLSSQTDLHVYADPRLEALGHRVLMDTDRGATILKDLGFNKVAIDIYDQLRLRLSVPDGSRDMWVDKATLLESGIDHLNGVDFKKGCFVGQELTARMKYRGLVRKRLMPVEIDGEVPAPGTLIEAGGREIGEMRSGMKGIGLALLRLDRAAVAETEGRPLLAGASKLCIAKPSWMTDGDQESS